MSEAPPPVGRPGRAAILVAVAVVHLAGFWFLWHTLAPPLADGVAVDAVAKDFFFADQVDYLSGSRNVADGGQAYAEPYTETGESIYPSGYYWLLGWVARLLGVGVLGAWNLVGMAVTVGLLAAVGGWAAWAGRSRAGWLLGPVPVVVGTLQTFTGGSWLSRHGDHAVLWPPFAVLFNPGAEPAALLPAGAALFAVLRGLRDDDVRWLAGAGAAAGLAVNLHTYVATLTALACLGAVAAFAALTAASRRMAAVAAAGTVLVAAVWAVLPSGSLLPRLGVLVAALAAVALVGRPSVWRGLAGFAVAAGVVGAPVVVRTALQVPDENSFFHLRQQWATDVDLALPAGRVLLQSLPVLALAGVCLAWLLRRRADRAAAAWAAVVIGLLAVGGLLVFNRAWGLDQEPYRFFPLTLFLLTAAAAPVLAAAIPTRGLAIGRAVAVVALVATLPTAVSFYRDTTVTVGLTADERAAFAAVDAALPADGLVLLDLCIPPGMFKTTTGRTVAFYNRGLAIPSAFGPISQVQAGLMRGRLMGDDVLAAAGITSFVTQTYCNSPPLDGRFDEPVARVPFTGAAECGLPADTEYVVYRVRPAPPARNVAATRREPTTPRLPFKEGFGHPRPGQSPRCASVGALY